MNCFVSQLFRFLNFQERPIVRQPEKVFQPFLSWQTRPWMIETLLVSRRLLHPPVGDLEQPSVRQPEKTFQPLYFGNDLFGVHTVRSFLYSLHVRTGQHRSLIKVDQGVT